jgi:hypothetical protein
MEAHTRYVAFLVKLLYNHQKANVLAVKRLCKKRKAPFRLAENPNARQQMQYSASALLSLFLDAPFSMLSFVLSSSEFSFLHPQFHHH